MTNTPSVVAGADEQTVQSPAGAPWLPPPPPAPPAATERVDAQPATIAMPTPAAVVAAPTTVVAAARPPVAVRPAIRHDDQLVASRTAVGLTCAAVALLVLIVAAVWWRAGRPADDAATVVPASEATSVPTTLLGQPPLPVGTPVPTPTTVLSTVATVPATASPAVASTIAPAVASTVPPTVPPTVAPTVESTVPPTVAPTGPATSSPDLAATPAVPAVAPTGGAGSPQFMNDPLPSGLSARDVGPSFAVAQELADALATEDWDAVRAIDVDSPNATDAQLLAGYGGLDRASLLLLDARPEGDGHRLLVVSVANEKQGEQTTLYCLEWSADAGERAVDQHRSVIGQIARRTGTVSPEAVRNDPALDQAVRNDCRWS